MSTFTVPQQCAVAADGNVLVSAGAGTGKTRTMVERCLRLIGEGCSLESILMVTFTEAAAAEMRARLRKELERWKDECVAGTTGSDPSSTMCRDRAGVVTGVPKDRFGTGAASPAREMLEEQIALLDTAHVSTLHRFCLQLVRDHFQELEIDPQVNVLDEAQSQSLMQEVLDELFDQCYRGELEFAVSVQQLIRKYGSGSDGRIRALVCRLHRYTQSLPPDPNWYERELDRLARPQPDHWRPLLMEAVDDWRDEWLPVLEQCEPCDNISRCIIALRKLSRRSTSEDMRAAMESVRVADEEVKWTEGRKRELRKPVAPFLDEAQFFRSLVTPRGETDPLAEDWDWMREPMRALLLLARRFTEQFTKAKRAQGGVDFADLEQLALRLLLDERGQATETARAWQGKFEHVFVDECQDINAAQDAIIRAVSRSEGNRFLVGDVKQSIYRFRLADPGIFRRYEEEWRQGHDGQRIALADNFRSRERILQFINPLFAALMRQSIGGVTCDSDAQLRFGDPERRAALSAASDSVPRVELHVLCKTVIREPGEAEESDAIDESNEEARPSSAVFEDVLALEKEARLVAMRLRQMHERGHTIWDEGQKRERGVEWRDMVVLLRSPGTRVETFAREFGRAGIPLSAARPGFYSAIEVLDLLNLLKLLDNPLQDIPLAAVLRSPLVGMSVDEMAAVRIEGSGEPRSSFYAAVRQVLDAALRLSSAAEKSPVPNADGTAAIFSFLESARAKLRAFFLQFEHWRSLVRQTSLSYCLETVLVQTHYEALLLAQPRGRERVANVRRLLELAREYDPFQRHGLYRFLRFVREQEEAELEQEAAAVETANAVRLMSIHRSKGLEFPVVVLACLAGQFNMQDLREDILLSADHGLCAKIIPPHIEQRYPSLPWWLAKRRETRELLGEEMRLLYVAMTRARDTLILTAFDKGRRASRRWERDENVALSEHLIVRAKSYFTWLRLWLGATTTLRDWQSDEQGQTSLLHWKLYSEDAPEFSRTRPEVTAAGPCAENEPAIDLDALRRRLTWEYGFGAATTEAAKTTVSVLRRRVTEKDDEARDLFRPRGIARAGLSAVDIGTAHHLFLQQVKLDRVGSFVELRCEAERLVAGRFLLEEQAAALDFQALLRFWQSPAGNAIRAEAPWVHRELPFTARFTSESLRSLGLTTTLVTNEFIVVQGVVDLAVIRSDSLAILDFKTDVLSRGDLDAKMREYTPQLKLYASALSRIYARPVREMSLHFLALGETRPALLA